MKHYTDVAIRIRVPFEFEVDILPEAPTVGQPNSEEKVKFTQMQSDIEVQTIKASQYAETAIDANLRSKLEDVGNIIEIIIEQIERDYS